MTYSSFDPAYFEPLYTIEDQHFWFRTRRAVISNMAKQITADLEPGYRVLEIGCGTGNILQVLQNVCSDGVVFGMDLFSEGLKYARKRTSCSLVKGDICALPFSKKLDLIGLFDVLEHIPDDTKVLVDLQALLADNGVLLLTAPAHPWLWSYFDDASHHCRRYELTELKNKLTSTGYRIEYITYYMSIILPFVWMERRLKGMTHKRPVDYKPSDELCIIPVANDLLAELLSIEARLIARKYNLPIGTSLLAVASKAPEVSRNSGMD